MPVQNVNPRSTLASQIELAQEYARCFNEAHPVGSTVWWWSTTLGPVYETTVSRAAFVKVKGDIADAEVELVDVPNSVLVVRCGAVREWQRGQLKVMPLSEPVVPLVCEGWRLSGLGEEELKKWKDPAIQGFGPREHLLQAADYFRQAADMVEAAYNMTDATREGGM